MAVKDREEMELIAYNTVGARKALGVGKTTFFKILKTGELDVRKLGRTTLISAESLRRYRDSLPRAQYRTNGVAPPVLVLPMPKDPV